MYAPYQGVGYANVYPNRAGGPGPMAATNASSVTNGNNAPAIAWVGIVIALIIVRVLYDMGARVE